MRALDSRQWVIMVSVEMRREASAAGLMVAAAALAAGIWLAFLGWQRGSTALGLWGLALAIAAPAAAVAAARSRIELESGPFEQVAAAESSLRYIKLARAHVCTLAAGAVVYGFGQFIGFFMARGFVAGYIVIVVAGLAVYLPWLARLEKRTYDQLEISRDRLRSAREGSLLVMR